MGLGSNHVVTGIDVGASSVKVVRLSHTRGAAEVLGLALVEIPDGSSGDADEGRDRIADSIAEALANAGA